jgi:hypothetical protein
VRKLIEAGRVLDYLQTEYDLDFSAWSKPAIDEITGEFKSMADAKRGSSNDEDRDGFALLMAYILDGMSHRVLQMGV